MQGWSRDTCTQKSSSNQCASNTIGLYLFSLPYNLDSQAKIPIGIFLACNVDLGVVMVHMDLSSDKTSLPLHFGVLFYYFFYTFA